MKTEYRGMLDALDDIHMQVGEAKYYGLPHITDKCERYMVERMLNGLDIYIKETTAAINRIYAQRYNKDQVYE